MKNKKPANKKRKKIVHDIFNPALPKKKTKKCICCGSKEVIKGMDICDYCYRMGDECDD